MATYPDIPGNHEIVYIVTMNNLLDFEPVKIKLLTLKGVEDVLFNKRTSVCEMTLLTDGTVSDENIQAIVVQQGFEAFPKKFLIS